MTNSAYPDQLPTDLDLHCLLRQGMSCSAREGLISVASKFGSFTGWASLDILILAIPYCQISATQYTILEN